MLSFPVKVDVKDSYSLEVADKMTLYYVKHYRAISSLNESVYCTVARAELRAHQALC